MASRPVKEKGHGSVAEGQFTSVISSLQHPFHKSLRHLPVRTGHRNLHLKFFRSRKFSHIKSGQPPVTVADGKNSPASLRQFHGQWQHLIIGNTLKMSVLPLFGFQQSSGMVNADFTAGVNPVLSLPELNQPGLAQVIKIDRLAVENHMEMGRAPVKGRVIPELPLPGIFPGRQNIHGGQIGKPPWMQ